MFFTYRQNNSGGVFTGPARVVVIEAPDAESANAIGETLGLYFDGRGDCNCCGDRWSKAYDDEGTDSPELYGEPITDADKALIVRES